mmetsp:Transcript_124714/g.216205  ORF Transcript_124714/g.216205 Transcript_124714/m.216205 type:complete len:205 (-) Transcript_124714:59-673(-)
MSPRVHSVSRNSSARRRKKETSDTQEMHDNPTRSQTPAEDETNLGGLPYLIQLSTTDIRSGYSGPRPHDLVSRALDSGPLQVLMSFRMLGSFPMERENGGGGYGVQGLLALGQRVDRPMHGSLCFPQGSGSHLEPLVVHLEEGGHPCGGNVSKAHIACVRPSSCRLFAARILQLRKDVVICICVVSAHANDNYELLSFWHCPKF